MTATTRLVHGAATHKGGGEGQVCEGTISTGIISEGENFVTSLNSKASCHCTAGSRWFLISPGRLWMVSPKDTARN